LLSVEVLASAVDRKERSKNLFERLRASEQTSTSALVVCGFENHCKSRAGDFKEAAFL
jgi:hypothetical protein